MAQSVKTLSLTSKSLTQAYSHVRIYVSVGFAWFGLAWLAWLDLAWPSHSSYLHAYDDATNRMFEKTAYKILTQGNYPEESIQLSEHFESLQ